MRAMLLERLDGIGEGQPFGDAHRQMVLVLQLLHHQEVVPLGVILHAGDAVNGRIGQCQRECPLALGRRRRRDLLDDHLHRRVFAHDAGELACAVVIELAALGIGRSARDASRVKRRGVHDGDVAIDALEERRMSVRHGVELLPRGQRLLRPQCVVPAAALQPLAGGCGLCGALDAIEHLLQRFASREIDGELDAAGVAQMGMRIVDAGHGKGAAEIDEPRLRPFRLQQRLICTGRGDESIPHRDRADEVQLALAEAHAGQDVAVVVDGVRRPGLRSERQRGGK